MKINKYSELQGEWWIVDGQPLYADGSIGDKNHESYVIDYVQSLYADDEFNKGDYINWSLFERKVLKEKLQELGIPESDDNEKLLFEALIEKGMTSEEIEIARGYGDAREYGISHLGWKRVKQNYIETQNLSAKDLAHIANGLWTAYEGADEEELSFTIEVRSNNTMYDEVPLSVIERNTPSDLIPYRRARYAKLYNWYIKCLTNKYGKVS